MRPSEPAANASFLFHDVPFEHLDGFPNAIEDIHGGRFHGLIVRGVFAPDAVESLARQIERGQAPIEPMVWQKHEHGPRDSTILGRPFMVDMDAARYLASAAQFREGCRALFAGLPDFEARMTSVFQTLCRGRQVSVPAAPNGATYSPATIRVLQPGHGIHVHVGNDFIRLPQARQLAACADVSCQLSYFVTLRPAQSGGNLTVFSLQWSHVEEIRKQRGGLLPEDECKALIADLVARSESVSLEAGAGDLILFDGGRYYHKVTRVQGPHSRITIGGFLVFSTDHDTIFYWS